MALRALQGPTGGGAPVGGGGTSSPSTIPRWTGPSTLGDSGLIDNGTAIYTTTRNVGIGTASPTAYAGYTTLAVNNATNGGLIEIQKAGAVVGYINGVSGMLFLATGANQATIGTAGAGSLVFRTNAADVARIDSSGRLLVGTSAAPSSGEIRQLVAPGTGANGGQQWAAPTAGGAAITPIATNGGAIFYRYSGSVSGETYVERFNFSSTAIQFKDGANLLASIDNSGNVTLPFGGSTVNVSTTNAGVKLPATPGNADTQTLDAYREDTFTTSFSGLGNCSNVSASNLRFTQIGRLVTIEGTFTFTVTAATTQTNFNFTLPSGRNRGSTANAGCGIGVDNASTFTGAIWNASGDATTAAIYFGPTNPFGAGTVRTVPFSYSYYTAT